MPIYIYKCVNKNCKTDTFDEYRHTAHNSDVSECPECHIQAMRSYHGQTVNSRIGKIKSYRNGHVVWEDIDNVPAGQDLNTNIKGTEIDNAKIEIS